MSVIQFRYSPVGCGVPQKSTVDTREFISYTQDVEELIQSHSLALHLYADDTQLLSVMQLEEITSRKAALEDCVSSVLHRCARRLLHAVEWR